MARLRDLTRFVAPLLQSDPMLDLQGTRLFVGPMRHVALIVDFYPGSEGIQSFALDGGAALFVDRLQDGQLTVRQCDAMHLTGYGTTVYGDAFRDRFLADLLTPLVAALRRIDTCQKHRVYLEQEMCFGSRFWTKLPDDHVTIDDIAVGEFDQFRGAWNARRHDFGLGSKSWFRPEARAYVSGLWDAIDRGDMAGLAGLLHDWERRRVEEAGILHLWAPSPFPFEEPNPVNWRDIDADALMAPFHELDRLVREVRHWRTRIA